MGGTDAKQEVRTGDAVALRRHCRAGAAKVRADIILSSVLE